MTNAANQNPNLVGVDTSLYPEGYHEHDQQALANEIAEPVAFNERMWYDGPSEDLIKFMRLYVQRVPFDKMPPMHNAELIKSYVQMSLHESFSLVALSVTPDGTYTGYTRNDKRIFRDLADRLQTNICSLEEEVVDDDFIELVSSVLASPDLSAVEEAQLKLKVIYVLPDTAGIPDRKIEGVRIFEQPNLIAAHGQTGYRTWEAAKYLMDTTCIAPFLWKAFKKRQVLELGAGTGLISLSVLKNGKPTHVFATDGDPEVIERLTATAKLNFNPIDREFLTVKEVKWFNKGLYIDDDADAALRGQKDGFTMKKLLGAGYRANEPLTIVAADVTYDPEAIPDLLRTIGKILAHHPDSIAMIAITVRNDKTLDVFTQACKSRPWIVEESAGEEIARNHPDRCSGIYYNESNGPNKIVMIQRDDRPGEPIWRSWLPKPKGQHSRRQAARDHTKRRQQEHDQQQPVPHDDDWHPGPHGNYNVPAGRWTYDADGTPHFHIDPVQPTPAANNAGPVNQAPAGGSTLTSTEAIIAAAASRRVPTLEDMFDLPTDDERRTTKKSRLRRD